MHEITLCQSAFEIIDSQAKLNNAKKVKKRMDGSGALSCVEVSALEFCFDIVCRDTLPKAVNYILRLSPQKHGVDCHQLSLFQPLMQVAHLVVARICALKMTMQCE